MNESVVDIIEKIRERTDKEYEHGKTVRAICRGNILPSQVKKEKEIWITNTDPTYTQYGPRFRDGSFASITDSTCDALRESGQLVVAKNKSYAQRILHNYEGYHEVVYEGRLIKFDILNSATYTNPSNGQARDVTSIHVATAGMKDYMTFPNIAKALAELKEVAGKQKIAREAEEAAKQKLAELEEKQKIAEEERQRLLQQARDEEERKRIEEEKRKQQEENLRQIQEEQERQRKAEEERKQVEKELIALSDKYAKAANFIRKQASLRLNPVLDLVQDEIKFSHVLDGTTVVINGGPGTGKTTTLIQRLKLLISQSDLLDYRENHEECKLTDEQIRIASDPERNWIFFSPTELLRQFMRENMEYEGLTDTTRKTVVWADYLKKTLVRDKYQFAGEEYPFDFARSSMNEKPIFNGSHITIINRFIREYVIEMKKKLQVVANLKTDSYKWKFVGKRISDICKGADKVVATTSLARLMFELDKIRDLEMPPGIPTAKDVVAVYKEQMQRISTTYLAEWRKDEMFYDELMEMAKSWKNNNLTEEEEEEAAEMDEDEILAGAENKLMSSLKTLIKRLALHTIDSKITITGRTKALYDRVKDRIKEDDYTSLAEYAFFMQYFYPIIHNWEGYLFSKITSIYKNFRREALKTGMAGWNKTLLKKIVEDGKNRPLCQQEQALLIGFINNLILSIRSVSIRRFDSLKHKFAVAYKDVCRPVIGIDEATDYTLVDYYAINSLRHYKVSSFTLTGDMMQGMRVDGVTNWMDLQRTNLFSDIEVKNLTKSYRQSPELMRLADTIYEQTMGQPSPYTSYLENDETCPKPLLFQSDDEEEKAEWITERVLEVKQKYGFVPSIAVFVADRDDARRLEDILKDEGRLENNGIDVKECSDADYLSKSDTLRIFTLENVKGMEFEVVFFHDIDKVKVSKMISRYLYVGLSRATFYMGVTATDTSIGILPSIINEFDTEGSWE